jgi:hypothetical protein
MYTTNLPGQENCFTGGLLQPDTGFCKKFYYDKFSMPWRGFANGVGRMNQAIVIKLTPFLIEDLVNSTSVKQELRYNLTVKAIDR